MIIARVTHYIVNHRKKVEKKMFTTEEQLNDFITCTAYDINYTGVWFENDKRAFIYSYGHDIVIDIVKP